MATQTTTPAFLDTTPYQDGRAYTIARDGLYVTTTTNPLAYFHNRHAYSMAHALQHEGYTVTPAQEPGA